MIKLNVLVACEESQRVCCAFRKLGHNAFSADLQDCSGGHPEWHIKGDVSILINGYCSFTTCSGDFYNLNSTWDLIVAHPPCTYFSCAGACNLLNKDHSIKDLDRYYRGLKSKDFFMSFLNSNCHYVCVENPRPIGLFNLPPCSCKIQPYEFGEPYSKYTYLWLKNLPVLMPTSFCVNYTTASKSSWFNSGNYKYRQINRSKTFIGVANAIAEQYSHFILFERGLL